MELKKFYNISIVSIFAIYMSVNIILRTLTMQEIVEIKYLQFGLYLFLGFLITIYIVGIVNKLNTVGVTDIIIFLLIIFGIISVIYAYDINFAIFGSTNRNEGIIALITYYFFYLVSKSLDKDYHKMVIYTFLLTGLVPALYSILQIVDVSFVHDSSLYVTGIFGNANFNSSYMLLCLSAALGLYVYDKSYEKFTLLLIGVYSFSLFISNSTSGLVGLAAVLFFILFSKNYKKIIHIIIILATTFACYTVFFESDLFFDIFKLGKETSTIITTLEVDDTVGTTRGYVWKETIKNVPENLVNGIGIDNLRFVNDGEPIIYKGLIFDKAHCELLQILITQGIFVLLFYISLYGYSTINYLKSKKTQNMNIIFLIVIGYIIQALFNISVISVAPVFFIFLGLLNHNDKKLYINDPLNI